MTDWNEGLPGEAELSMRKRTAIVHIGLEKTGSTAIQRWLAFHQQALQDAGILIPRSVGFPNHTKLVSACLDDGVVDNIKSHHLFVTGLSEARFRSTIFADLSHEVQRADPSWHTLVISSELISSRLSSQAEINRLVSEIGLYVDHIHFVIFLRRQDQLALSRFSSILRSGYGQFDDLYVDYSPFNFLRVEDARPISDDLFFYDFEAILSRFDGLPNCELGVFFYGVDRPINIFAQLLKFDENSRFEPRHNSALSAEAQFILAQLNQCYPVQFPSGRRNDAYRQLQRQIEREVSGPPRMISRQSAEDFLSRYREANQRVCERFARSPEEVFSDDLSNYPLEVDYSQLPIRVRDQLLHYQVLSKRIPVKEPFAPRIYSEAHRLKGRIKGLVARRPLE